MNGVPDTYKGSYYANPLSPSSPIPADWKEQAPVYYGDNVWPSEDENEGEGEIKGFQEAFKALGEFVAGVGGLVARACEGFGE